MTAHPFWGDLDHCAIASGKLLFGQIKMLHPRPVWFLWQGPSILVYSRPNTFKISHIDQNPEVVLNFDGDGEGGNIVVIYGQACLPQEAPPADQVEAYVAKYHSGMKHLNLTKEQFARRYSAVIQITPERVRGH